MNIREQQYFLGISTHEFKKGKVFSKYKETLKDIYDGNLKEGYYFENKYNAEIGYYGQTPISSGE